MKTLTFFRYLLVPFSLMSVSTISVGVSSPIPGNTFLIVIVNLLIVFCIYRLYKSEYKKTFVPKYGDFFILKYYIAWALFNLLRGIIVADYYWDYKNLLLNGLCTFLPLFYFTFYNPKNVSRLLRFWAQWLFPLFFAIAPFLTSECYFFYLAPFYILGLFLPIMPRKWIMLTFFCLVFLILSSFSARSQVVKSLGCILLCILFFYDKYVSRLLSKFIHFLFFFLPLLFLTLALSGVFNVLAMEEYMGRIEVSNSKGETESFTGDDRSHLFVDVINSALVNNYVLWGRTPARGNDTLLYEDTEVLKDTKRYERAKNEVCHLNIFTWEGLIGLILYSLVYFIASTKAVYHSRNTLIRMVGVYVAFRWLYGWVEDFNNFDLANMILWMMISMCYSPLFRGMDDQGIRIWVRTCLPQSFFKKESEK